MFRPYVVPEGCLAQRYGWTFAFENSLSEYEGFGKVRAWSEDQFGPMQALERGFKGGWCLWAPYWFCRDANMAMAFKMRWC